MGEAIAVGQAAGQAVVAAGPGLAKTQTVDTIDLSSRGAKDALDRCFPHVLEPVVAAPDSAEKWAVEYMRARQQEAEAKAKKDIAANHLRSLIGPRAGIVGTSFSATWSEMPGGPDWQGLVEALEIDQETIERYRRPGHRTLTVTAK